ncbi:exported protein of unknown function [Pararobbsia alpina]
MRRALSIAATQVALCFAHPCYADDSYDVFVHAAYCLGFEYTAAAYYRNFASGIPADSDIANTLKTTVDDATEKASRLRAYVIPRALASEEGTLAASAAQQRGIRDARRAGIGSEGDADPALQECQAKCLSAMQRPLTPQDSQCAIDCAPDLYSHLRSCADLSWLPF